MRIKLLLVCALLTLTTSVFAQQDVKQSGSVTPGHAVRWITNGIAGDGGTAASGSITSLGVTAAGPGICQNSGPITGPYVRICLGVTTGAPAQLSVTALNGATPQGLQFLVNGVNGLTNTSFQNMAAATIKGNPTAATAAVQDFTLAGLTAKAVPLVNADLMLVWDSVSGELRKSTVGQIATSATAGVSQLGGLVGALNLGTGLGTSGGNTITNTGVTSIFGSTGALVLSTFTSNGLAPIASPTFTGTPAAPTAAFGTSTTQLATTAFVRRAAGNPSLDLYVATTGSDASNACDVQLSPCLTVQRAVDECPLASVCNINVAAGTYNLTATTPPVVNVFYYKFIAIFGPNSSPCVDPTLATFQIAGNALTGFTVQDHAILAVQCVRITTNGTGNTVFFARQFGILDANDIYLGTSFPAGNIFALDHGSVGCSGSWTVTGGASAFVNAGNLSHLNLGCFINMANPTSFTGFLIASDLARITAGGATFTGPGAINGSTGTQCLADGNAVIRKGSVVFPGNTLTCSSAQATNGGLILP